MRKRERVVWTVVVAMLAMLSLVGCGRTGYHNFPPTARGEWVAFGDSLTSGYGAATGKAYPALLAARLDLPIRNHGTPGLTTQVALGQLETVARTAPRVVLLCLGGNDGLQQLSREAMFKNLEAMIDRFHAEGSFVILIGIRSTTLRDKNTAGFKQLADRKQLLLVPDILDGVLGDPRLMSDQVHPNEAGYAAIADRLERVIRPLLPQLR